MKFLKSLAVAGSLMLTLPVSAQTEWLHIYRNDGKFHTMPIDSVESLSITARSTGSASGVKLTNTAGKNTNVSVSVFTKVGIGGTVPSIYITTNEYIDDVHDKTTWYDSKITIHSYGFPGMEDLDETDVKLRGRGNSTLGYNKKPYRIKFDKKTEIHSDLLKAKNYVLLANYIDPSLMRNPVAFAVGRLLDLPYTCHAIPVNVWLNDIYRGSYMLCEKVGLNSGSVYDIEETEGVLLELDTNYDASDVYFSEETSITEIPVSIKDPDFEELEKDGKIASASASQQAWEDDYRRLERAIMGESGEDWTDLLDLESAVRYFMAYNVTGNCEPKHPKSVFIHKAKMGEKYYFGPIWDFDWAYTYDGFEGNQQPTVMLFGPSNSGATHYGTKLFMNIVSDERFQQRYGELWSDFVENLYPQLVEFMDEYAQQLEPSAALNGEKWSEERFMTSSYDIATNYGNLRKWLDQRVEFISTAANYGFYIDYSVSVDPPAGMYEVPLSSDNVVGSDPDPDEGSIDGLFDGDRSTIYHSDYHSNDRHDPVYGSYLDITLPQATTSVGFDIWARAENLNGTPDQVDIYAFDDEKNDWYLLGTATNITTIINRNTNVTEARLSPYSSSTPFTKVRFAVVYSACSNIPLTWDLSGWGMMTYWNLSELRMYAK